MTTKHTIIAKAKAKARHGKVHNIKDIREKENPTAKATETTTRGDQPENHHGVVEPHHKHRDRHTHDNNGDTHRWDDTTQLDGIQEQDIHQLNPVQAHQLPVNGVTQDKATLAQEAQIVKETEKVNMRDQHYLEDQHNIPKEKENSRMAKVKDNTEIHNIANEEVDRKDQKDPDKAEVQDPGGAKVTEKAKAELTVLHQQPKLRQKRQSRRQKWQDQSLSQKDNHNQAAQHMNNWRDRIENYGEGQTSYHTAHNITDHMDVMDHVEWHTYHTGNIYK